MSDLQGSFVWYELATTDPAGAKAFYGKVAGWRMQDMPMPGMTYTLLHVGDMQVAGLMELPEEARKMGAPPHWLGYVGVADVDAGVAQSGALGGGVVVPPMDIPEIGRFAVVTDPQGAAIALFRGAGMEAPPRPAPGTPGGIGWHELSAADWQAVFPYYAGMFGWRKAEPIDMGPMGIYQLFAAGEQTIGGMFDKPAAMPRPAWLYYFRVGDIDAATATVQAEGGKVLNGPMQVPGGDWIIQGQDPQGAMFALVGGRA